MKSLLQEESLTLQAVKKLVKEIFLKYFWFKNGDEKLLPSFPGYYFTMSSSKKYRKDYFF